MRRTRIFDKELYLFFLIIYIVCLPLNAINIGSLGSVLKIIAALPIGVAFCCGRKLAFNTPIRAQLFFTMFAIFSTLWSVSLADSVKRSVSYLLLFALLLSGTVFKYTEENTNRVKQALVWSSRLTAVVTLLFAEYVNGRAQLTGTITEDPNYLCAYFTFGVVYTLEVLNKKTKGRRKVLAAIELVLYLYLILISGSRGGLLAILAAITAYLITLSNRQVKHVAKKVILVVLSLGIIAIILNYLPENLQTRFTMADVVEDGGSGRTEIWQQAIDLFANGSGFHQMFGYGTATIIRCFTIYGYSRKIVVHNMFLETLVELGLLGMISYITAVFSFIKSSVRFKDKFAFAVIIGMLVMSLSTSIYTFKPYFNAMLFIIIIQNTKINCARTDLTKEQA